MKSLITGASSGIGKYMAIYLSELGYDLILVARRKEKLEELKNQLTTNVKIIITDLSIEENVYELYKETKSENIDLLINNAGFGLFGFVHETNLEDELKMINLNIKTPHILTKLFIKDFIKKDQGMVLNVASSAGFMPGPKLNTYYATKNYLTKYTLAIYEELIQIKSNVSISCLCPGPVDTEFNKVAKGNFKLKGANPEYIAKYAIDKTLKRKMLIIPTISMKMSLFLTRFIPTKLLLKINYNIQERKSNNVR